MPSGTTAAPEDAIPMPIRPAQPWRRARRLLDFRPDYARSSVAVAALP